MFSSNRIRAFSLSRLILMVTLLVSLCALPAYAQTGQKEAEALNSIGLFSGSDKGFELERTPTRAEALVMLLKLTGQAQTAMDSNLSHPFTDGGWASAFIGYGYTHNYTSGMTATEFGTAHPATAQQYSVFLLRALGYTINEDYTYEKALPFFLSHAPALMLEGDTFTRGGMVSMSLAALAAPMKDGSGTLAEKLSAQGLFSMESYQAARDGAISEEKAETTVLVYMVGSDLESGGHLATDDIHEMLDADLNESVNVILQTGGTKDWKNDWMTDGTTQRFQLTDDDVVHLSTLEDSLMSQPDTLSNFLRWGVTAYPAQRYLLVLWNHGEGTLNGFGVDEMNNSNTLSLGDMSRALNWADVYFELVGFDACLMATLTNAYIFRDYADYLLASEEMEPLEGWHYTRWLTELSNQPGRSAEQIYQIIAKDYLTFENSGNWDDGSTISLLDLSHIEVVMQEWQTLLKELAKQMKAGQFDLLETAFLQSKYYGVNSLFDQIDLVDYLAQLKKAGIREVGALTRAVKKVVLNSDTSSGLDTIHGLAVYIPYRKYDNYLEKTRASLLECGFEENRLEFFDLFSAQAAVSGPKRPVKS